MHHIYHTHGFILGSRNRGEANKMLTIYTRELGLVRAAAQGVRLHKSKLRFALQDYSYVSVDLVRGRDIWRVTSARSENTFAYARRDSASLQLIARLSKLIERLCDGEEPSAEIFDDLHKALTILDTTEIENSKRQALELHLVLRIMNMLGYIGASDTLSPYLTANFEDVESADLLKSRATIVSYINKALTESQL